MLSGYNIVICKNDIVATYYIAVEFPAVLLDLETGKIVDEFQQYVLPRDNPKLSDFCKALTGISQVRKLMLVTLTVVQMYITL